MAQKIIYFITAFTLLAYCCSCNQLDGTIEKRNGNRLYLVNNSKTKEFRFTVKATKITNDSIFEYSTSQNYLAPGDELYLGNENETAEKQYPTIEKKKLKTYEIIGKEIQETKIVNGKRYYKDKKGDWYEVPKFDPTKPYNSVEKLTDFRFIFFDEEGLPIPTSLLKDTLIDGKEYKYHYIIEKVLDSLHPFPQIHYKYTYTVTGQLEIRDSKSKISR